MQRATILELVSILQKEEQTHGVQSVLKRLHTELSYFTISRMTRDDLFVGGFIPEVSDDVLDRVADKMGDDYCEQLFWSSMSIIAEDNGVLKVDKIVSRLRNFCKDVSDTTTDGDDRTRSELFEVTFDGIDDEDELLDLMRSTEKATIVNIVTGAGLLATKYKDPETVKEYTELASNLLKYIYYGYDNYSL